MVIRLIPTEGGTNPTLPMIGSVWAGMVKSLGTLHDVKLTVGNDHDLGWDEIVCPSCGTGIDPYWFAELYDTQGRFSNQQSSVITLPCCAGNVNLFSLARQVKKPVAGLVFSFRAQGRSQDTQVIRRLEQFLNHPLCVYYDLEQVEDGTVCLV